MSHAVWMHMLILRIRIHKNLPGILIGAYSFKCSVYYIAIGSPFHTMPYNKRCKKFVVKYTVNQIIV